MPQGPPSATLLLPSPSTFYNELWSGQLPSPIGFSGHGSLGSWADGKLTHPLEL